MTISAKALGQLASQPGVASELRNSFPTFEPSVLAGYASDSWFSDAKNTSALSRRGELWLRGSALAVPDHGDLRTTVLRLCHDHPLAGHAGATKTLGLVRRQFWWPRMRGTVVEYCRTCDSCQRVKAAATLEGGKLLPLPIPDQKWSIGALRSVQGYY